MGIRRLRRRYAELAEQGQAVIIFVAALIILLGCVGLSVDVGRLMWAKSEMQSSVDAAALAGAQSMPNGAAAGTSFASQYWDSNKATIVANSDNVTVSITTPGDAQAVRVEATAEVPTFFVKFFGIDHWDVKAVGQAEAKVLDIALILDISGSMCFTSYPPIEGNGTSWKGIVMGPGRANPSGFTQPKLAQFPYPAQPTLTYIPANTNSTITIKLNSVSIFNTTNNTSRDTLFGDYWNSGSSTSGKKYHEIAPNGARAGMIMINDEVMKITGVDGNNNTLTVTRAQTRLDTSTTTQQQLHAQYSEVYANRSTSGSAGYCDVAAKYARSSSVDGPHQPFDDALDNASYFIGLFNAAYDKIGVASFSSTATITANLTGTSFSSLHASINGFPYPSGGTNIAHGISIGRKIIDGTGKRPNAVKIIVLLTDGAPTDYCSGQTSSSTTYGHSSCTSASSGTISTCTTTTGVTHAINQATVAKSQGIIVYTIGLGSAAIKCILDDIAEAGGGENFMAPTTDQLDEVFQEIAEKTHIGLTG